MHPNQRKASTTKDGVTSPRARLEALLFGEENLAMTSLRPALKWPAAYGE
jgi:hypothetical protein